MIKKKFLTGLMALAVVTTSCTSAFAYVPVGEDYHIAASELEDHQKSPRTCYFLEKEKIWLVDIRGCRMDVMGYPQSEFFPLTL